MLMRVMGVDYGDARTGIAVSDETCTIVGDVWVINESNMQKTVESVVSEAIARQVGTIVVGYPKNMDGSIGPRAVKSEELVELIRSKCDIDVVLSDERLSTSFAHKILTDSGKHGKKRKKIIDAVAASIILESYLRIRN